MKASAEKIKSQSQAVGLTRRSFIKKSGATLAAFSIVPRQVLGGTNYIAPSDKITAACVGVGSQGTRVMLDFLKQPEIQIMAVCDVNTGSDNYVEWGQHEIRDKVRGLLNDDSWARFVNGALCGMNPAQEIVQRYYAAQRGKPVYKGCLTYRDYREILENEKGIDAVIIGSPDHLHAPIAVQAMQAGKHVYCQKPMAHTVYEARRMAEIAAMKKVATQVATGNAASEDTRILCEWIWSGAIGQVREVHNWSSRPFWPQGIERPADQPPVPEYLAWDLWLGPAPLRPYHPVYQPFVWRGWYDFGTSAIGDMGCYSFDTLFRVLKLTAPYKIEASSTKIYSETYPQASVLHFYFTARNDQPPLTIHWYDGGIKPAKPEELGEGELDAEGMLFVGDKGKILCKFSGGEPRLIPESAMQNFEPPPKTLPRSIGHMQEWIAACKGGSAAAANFEFAGPVTETILLANVALRAGKTIYWDPASFTVTNDATSNERLHFTYRSGWQI